MKIETLIFSFINFMECPQLPRDFHPESFPIDHVQAKISFHQHENPKPEPNETEMKTKFVAYEKSNM